jgi:ribosome biogenesis GTPase
MKGIAGFYYVDVVESGVYACRARGLFRKEGQKPLVGDNVEIEITDESDMEGNVVDILPRVNEMLRPNCANVDQVIVLLAMKKPVPHLSLVNRLLVRMEAEKLPVYLIFNKQDLVTEEETQYFRNIYEKAGVNLLFVSVLKEQNLDKVSEILTGKTTVLAGPSGVGKSSLLNYFCPNADMETGDLSKKIDRGKHTTRHLELFMVKPDTWLCDTPGFSSIYIGEIDEKSLKNYFPEFEAYEGRCRFQGCVHVNEPDCAVIEAVNMGNISRERYEGYVEIYKECHDARKY